ncbi:NaeI family type II restriction endonuclease [Amycolatopsis azurea]|uniref:Uncharacterized protein n=2 Tax=Amycolatopsis azurea DSM 43854 TaxID=1238180 RepID=A0ABX3JL24_9PSEU|nr:NaeI family type II restriction endonuclease [Amycolatopsis azurea]OOC08157.1 hypothetical protein B0293_04630 [Amycolatopsis azurea DSM 43854]
MIQCLELRKEPPLDTTILDIPVEIKGTVRNTWMIPREGRCEITLMIQIDAKQHRFQALLMRTHRAWLTGKKDNCDYALEVAPWTPLPPEPVRLLSMEQLRVVFGSDGMRKRVIALFGYLPEQVIPRTTITIVGAGLGDPLKGHV